MRDQNRCFICLTRNHSVAQCSSTRGCEQCQATTHATVICPFNAKERGRSPSTSNQRRTSRSPTASTQQRNSRSPTTSSKQSRGNSSTQRRGNSPTQSDSQKQSKSHAKLSISPGQSRDSTPSRSPTPTGKTSHPSSPKKILKAVIGKPLPRHNDGSQQKVVIGKSQLEHNDDSDA